MPRAAITTNAITIADFNLENILRPSFEEKNSKQTPKAVFKEEALRAGLVSIRVRNLILTLRCTFGPDVGVKHQALTVPRAESLTQSGAMLQQHYNFNFLHLCS